MHRAINAFVKEYYYGKEAHAARELQRDERRRNDLYQRRRRFYRSVCCGLDDWRSHFCCKPDLGLDQTRTWIKNNKKNGENITDLAAKGINAAADYMGKSIGNAIVGVYTALNLTGWWPVTAIAWVTA